MMLDSSVLLKFQGRFSLPDECRHPLAVGRTWEMHPLGLERQMHLTSERVTRYSLRVFGQAGSTGSVLK